MRPLSSLGVGLSLVFGGLLMALVVEIYYLFWWRRKKLSLGVADQGDDANSARGQVFFFFLCWGKKSSSSRSRGLARREQCGDVVEDAYHDAGVEAEVHHLSGPARFLFTIKEETKEDMESEDGRSRGDESRKGSGRITGDGLLLGADTPFFTPFSSPPYFFTPSRTPTGCPIPSHRGFSPLSELSSREGRVFGPGSSPPPKFKFLKDAEEKLYRKTLMEEAMRVQMNGRTPMEETPPLQASAAASSSTMSSAEDGSSFITIVIGRNQESGRQQHHSSSSQVTPLPTSPGARRPAQEKPDSNHNG